MAGFFACLSVKTISCCLLLGGLSYLFFRRPAVTHGGCVALRGQPGGEAHFLLVTARHNKSRWVLPKGKVEPGEAAAATALRELKEEAGCDGRILCYLGTLSYFKWGLRRIRIRFFLVQAGGVGRNKESRQVKWISCRQISSERIPRPMKRLLFKVAGMLSDNAGCIMQLSTP